MTGIDQVGLADFEQLGRHHLRAVDQLLPARRATSASLVFAASSRAGYAFSFSLSSSADAASRLVNCGCDRLATASSIASSRRRSAGWRTRWAPDIADRHGELAVGSGDLDLGVLEDELEGAGVREPDLDRAGRAGDGRRLAGGRHARDSGQGKPRHHVNGADGPTQRLRRDGAGVRGAMVRS